MRDSNFYVNGKGNALKEKKCLGKARYFFISIFLFTFFLSVLALASQVYVYNRGLTINLNESMTNYSSDLFEREITRMNVTVLNNSWLEFDGVNDVLTRSFTGYSRDLCFGSWFRKYDESVFDEIIEKSGVFRIRFESDDKIMTRFYFNDSSSSGECEIAGGGSSYEWQHVFSCFNSSSGNVTLYLNGTLIKTFGNFLGKYLEVNGNDLEIGGSSVYYFHGSIDEVRIYNRTLSSLEVSQIYESGLYPNSSLIDDDLFVWYHFNENSGATAHDISGGGYDAI